MDKIRELCSKNDIKLFDALCDSDKFKEMIFTDIIDLIGFIKAKGETTLLYHCYLEDLDDYLIDLEVIEDYSTAKKEELRKIINKHNKKVKELDFNEPSLIIVCAIIDGILYSYYKRNDVFYEIETSDEAWQTIEEEYCSDLIEEENEKLIKEYLDLREELKTVILQNEELPLCTNRSLRVQLARRMINTLGFRKKYEDRMSKHKRELWDELNDLVELCYRELKSK